MIQHQKLWTKSYISILALNVLINTSIMITGSIMAMYAVYLGASLSLAGTLVGIFAITALVLRPFSGALADRVNKKYLLCISTLLMGLIMFTYPFINSIPVFIVVRILHGASFSIFLTVIVSTVASMIPKERMGEGIGYSSMVVVIAMAVGPATGLTIQANHGFSATLLIAASIVCICSLGMLFVPINTETKKSDVKGRLSLKDLISVKLLPLALIVSFLAIFNSMTHAFLPLVGIERNITNIALFFLVSAICSILVRPVAGKLYDKKGLSFVLFPGFLAVAAGAVILAVASTIQFVVIAAVLFALGQSASQPSIQASIMKMMPPEKTGLAASTFFMGFDFGQGFGPMIGGNIADMWGYRAAFIFCGALMIVGMIVFAIYKRYRNDSKQPHL